MTITFTRQGAAAPAAVAAPAADAPALPAAPDDQRAKVAEVLLRLFGYLKDNAPVHPGLAGAITEMHTAVAAYQANQPGDPYVPVRKVLAVIEAQRKLDATVPKP